MSVESTLRKANKLARSGNAAGAAALYKQVLEKFPNNLQARKGLASLGPSKPSAHTAHPMPPMQKMQALQKLYERGDFPTVIAECQRLNMLFPNSPAVLNLQALALSGAGKFEEAIATFNRVNKIDPGFVGAWTNKGSTLIRMGRHKELEETGRAIIAINPHNPFGRMFLGYALVNTDRPEAAEPEFRKAVELAPREHRAHIGLGIALGALKRPEESLEAFLNAKRLVPNAPEVFNNIGNTLVGLERFEEAVEVFEQGLKLHPLHDQMRENYVKSLRDLGLNEEALKQAQIITERSPDNPYAWGIQGQCHRELGDFEAAITALERSVKINPHSSESVGMLWQTKTLPIDHPEFERIKAWAESENAKPAEVSRLEFTLFTALQKAGKPEAAFLHLERANKTRRQIEPYDIDHQRELFSAIREMFTSPEITLDAESIADIPAPSRPVFIVGMPRSGTTLVEQILASHSMVHGAGELAGMDRAMVKSGWRSDDVGLPPTREMLRDFRRNYLDFCARLQIPEPVFTDKAPLNFRWLGFALAAFPEARALVMRRDPRATCWSNYSHMFAGSANNFGTDMVDTAKMYRMHIEMTDYWKALFPERVTLVPYERLTEHQEEETRKILAAANLEWEDACLNFHKTKRAVRTSSLSQVRKKMYKGSSNAWRQYEQFLGPMLKNLGYES